MIIQADTTAANAIVIATLYVSLCARSPAENSSESHVERGKSLCARNRSESHVERGNICLSHP
jgi:hypothetical protein